MKQYFEWFGNLNMNNWHWYSTIHEKVFKFTYWRPGWSYTLHFEVDHKRSNSTLTAILNLKIMYNIHNQWIQKYIIPKFEMVHFILDLPLWIFILILRNQWTESLPYWILQLKVFEISAYTSYSFMLLTKI